jgi:hypothetical protein
MLPAAVDQPHDRCHRNAMEQDRSDDDIVPAVLHIAARAIERAR